MAVITYTDPVLLNDKPEYYDSSIGFITGIVVLAALVGLFFFYLLPYIQAGV